MYVYQECSARKFKSTKNLNLENESALAADFESHSCEELENLNPVNDCLYK